MNPSVIGCYVRYSFVSAFNKTLVSDCCRATRSDAMDSKTGPLLPVTLRYITLRLQCGRFSHAAIELVFCVPANLSERVLLVTSYYRKVTCWSELHISAKYSKICQVLFTMDNIVVNISIIMHKCTTKLCIVCFGIC